MSNLERLLAMVTSEENRFYENAFKAIEDNNMIGNIANIAQASAYQTMRYTIEDMLQEGQND